jgi:hypothetical protein
MNQQSKLTVLLIALSIILSLFYLQEAQTAAPANFQGDPAADIYWHTLRLGCPLIKSETQGASSANPTECYVGRRADDLYIYFVCHNAKPFVDDRVEVYLDVDHNQADYHQIMVFSDGQVKSIYHKKSPLGVNRGGSWASQAGIKINRQADTWTCEIRVPFTALAGIPKAGDSWGVNFGRDSRRADQEHSVSCEKQSWFNVSYFHNASRFGVFTWPGSQRKEPPSPVVQNQAPANPVSEPSAPKAEAPSIPRALPPSNPQPVNNDPAITPPVI